MAKKKAETDGGQTLRPYKVKSPVLYDHDRYEIGDTIELDEETAKQLLTVDAIEAENSEVKS